ncbi:hypothetical protein V8Z80_12530 [Orrella sp. JC864]|uniref:WD40 repeat domain-containing protein n=1 Tax=Orrella sp. JC864 TaxID=3120298 RepID=UPI003009368E
MKILGRLELGEPCLWAGFLDGVPCFLALDGRLHGLQGTARRTLALHDGDVLSFCVVPDPGGPACLLTAGEDGRVMRSTARTDPVCVATRTNKWISALAAGPDGAMAYASGRTVWLTMGSGEPVVLPQSRPVEALAFGRDGRRLAIGLYDALALQDTLAGTAPVELAWKGVPTQLAFSPDDRFVVACTRDAMMHGWRLDTFRHFRMVGYSRPPSGLSWLADGQWLATNGSEGGAVLWPFRGKDGPIGSTPLVLGDRTDAQASAVACHPSRRWVAVGYSDGLMALESYEGDVRRILGQAGREPVSCLAWQADGERLAYGTPSGACGVMGAGAGAGGS